MLGNEPERAWAHPLFGAMYRIVAAALAAGDATAAAAAAAAAAGTGRKPAAVKLPPPLLTAADFHPFFAYVPPARPLARSLARSP